MCPSFTNQCDSVRKPTTNRKCVDATAFKKSIRNSFLANTLRFFLLVKFVYFWRLFSTNIWFHWTYILYSPEIIVKCPSGTKFIVSPVQLTQTPYYSHITHSFIDTSAQLFTILCLLNIHGNVYVLFMKWIYDWIGYHNCDVLLDYVRCVCV